MLGPVRRLRVVAAVAAAAMLVGGCGGSGSPRAASLRVSTATPSPTVSRPTTVPLPANVTYRGEGLVAGDPVRVPRRLWSLEQRLGRFVDRHRAAFSGLLPIDNGRVFDVGLAAPRGRRLLDQSGFAGDPRVTTHHAALNRAAGLRLMDRMLTAPVLAGDLVAASPELDGSGMSVCLRQWPTTEQAVYLGLVPASIDLRVGCGTLALVS